MRILKLAAALLTLGMSGATVAATDGALGPTSTGTFNASINISPDTSNYVQVLGLEDMIFPDTAVNNSQQTPIASITPCFNKNTPGPITVTIFQGGPPDTRYWLEDSITGNMVAIALEVANPGGTLESFANNVPKQLAASATGCVAASGFNPAHVIQGTVTIPPNSARSVGAMSGSFTVLLSAQ